MSLLTSSEPAAADSDGEILSPADADRLKNVAETVAAVAPRLVDSPAWVASARHGWEDLPVALRRRVRAFRRNSGGHGTLLLRGILLDTPNMPPTPFAAGSVQRRATLSAAVLMSLACGLGDPAAFAAEKSGALVQDVVPVPGNEDVQGNVGSVPLAFHNENAFHRHRPDFVLLLCLRADHDTAAALRTACVRAVLPRLTTATRAALESPWFVTEPPPSFVVGAPAEPHAVLAGVPEDPDVRVDFAATKPLGSQAGEALAELATLIHQSAREVFLRPGDLAIVDNRVTMHGRSGFRPRYDGADRWLQRTFVCADLRRSRAFRPDDGYVLTG